MERYECVQLHKNFRLLDSNFLRKIIENKLVLLIKRSESKPKIWVP